MFAKLQDQRGMILVMSIILMAILLAIGLGFATIVISDIRQARQIDNAVVAYHGASTGIEENLFWLRRETDNSQPIERVSDLQVIAGDGELEDSKAQWNINDSTDFEATFTRQRLEAGRSVRLYVLGRAAGNATKYLNISWAAETNSGVKLQLVTTQLTYQVDARNTLIYYTDTNEVTNPGVDSVCIELKNGRIDGGELPTDVDYAIDIRVLGDDALDSVSNLRVEAYNDDNCSDLNSQGITNLSIRSQGAYAGSEQTITALIPPRDPISGLLGFVLFSEADITKDYQ